MHWLLLDAEKLGSDRLRTLIGHVSSVGRAADAGCVGLGLRAHRTATSPSGPAVPLAEAVISFQGPRDS
jgi:hypothetical protein